MAFAVIGIAIALVAGLGIGSLTMKQLVTGKNEKSAVQGIETDEENVLGEVKKEKGVSIEDEEEETDEDEVPEIKVGETWTVDGLWKVTINSVTETEERHTDTSYDGDKNPEAVYIVDYTYENLGYKSDSSGLGIDLSGVYSQIVDSDKEMGYKACQDSENDLIKEGNYGAGCGASVGKLLGFEHAMKGGIGTYGVQVGNVQVAGIVAVNACGNVIDYQTQEILAGVNIDKKCVSASQIILDQMDQLRKLPDGNTTIGCIVTNVKLTKAQCTKIAGISHNGYAKSIDPVHTMSDGDTIFVLSTNEVDGMVDAVGILAVEVISKCIQRAIKKAKSGYGLLAYQDLKK